MSDKNELKRAIEIILAIPEVASATCNRSELNSNVMLDRVANNCDGCMAGMRVIDGIHRDNHGKLHMVCESYKYRKEI